VTIRNEAPGKQGLYDPQFEHDACGIGFVVNIKGKKSHDIVTQSLEVLNNLNHRGACGCEANTGDGAGVLIQLPHAFLVKVAAKENIRLPELGHYGVAMMFLPRDPNARQAAEQGFEKLVAEEGQTFLGWRTVPTDNSALGPTARAGEPFIRQAFIQRAASLSDSAAFERALYILRKRAEHTLKFLDENGSNRFYIPSLSSRTIVYKGMLLVNQMEDFYPELRDTDMVSALALVHSRFSTNTFPNWNRAHPYRYIIHNGEINTVRGNVNWMHARESLLQSDVFGKDLARVLPVIDTDGSDSAMFDNCLEFLVLSGRSLPHAMMMMIPEPWANHESMSEEKKAFYEYHACLMEPWDGPASIGFTDGVRVGAVLDRNGLRPSRYVVTRDDFVVLASEVGVLDIAPERVVQKGRLQPGRMLLIDTEEGRIISDDEIKKTVASEHPYRQWLDKNLIALDDLMDQDKPVHEAHGTVVQRQQVFGYNYEDLRVVMEPMARNGVEPVGAMGTDTPLAVLSDRPQLLSHYFKQLFAQVTNPPIDCLREEIVTSASTTIGGERNILQPAAESCRLIELKVPS
jgi:glutamate synthase domain-containing protein 1